MPDHVFVYPAYLTRGSSRARGRRVPVAHAPEEATVEQIVEAAKALGFRAEAEPERSYPRQTSAYAGRVKVAKQSGISKTRLLRMLALEIRKRSGGPPGGR